MIRHKLNHRDHHQARDNHFYSVLLAIRTSQLIIVLDTHSILLLVLYLLHIIKIIRKPSSDSNAVKSFISNKTQELLNKFKEMSQSKR